MSEHQCNVSGCDGTKLGHELARDFPEATARMGDTIDRLTHPDDYLKAPGDEPAE